MKILRRWFWRTFVPHGLGQRLALATALASTLMLMVFGLYSLEAQSSLATRMLERGNADIAHRIAQEIARAVQVRESGGVENLLESIAATGGVRRLQVSGAEDRFYDRPELLLGVRPGLSERMPCADGLRHGGMRHWLIRSAGTLLMCLSMPLDANLPGVRLLVEFEAADLADVRQTLMFDTLAFASFGALASSLLGLWIGRRAARGVRHASEFAEHIEADHVSLEIPSGGSLEVRRLMQALVRAAHRLRQQRDLLIESQARNATVVNASLDAIVTMDEFGRIVDFNPAAERTFGHPKDAVLGQSMDDTLVPARLRRNRRDGVPHFLAGGDRDALGKRVEVTALRRDGQEFPAEMAIVEHRGGSQRLYTAYVRDISERVEAAGALSRSERRHREVLESLSEVVFSLDTRLRIVYVNAAWARLTGRGQDEAAGNALTDFIDVRDAALFSQTMRHAADRADEQRDLVEVRLRHVDGDTRWCLLECRVMTDADGFISGYGGSMIDVTAQRAAQTRLEDQLKFAETLVESVPHALFVRDTGSHFRAVNRAFEQLAGIDREQLLGQTPECILGESDEYQRVIAEDREMLEDCRPREREMSIPDRESGGVRWFRQYKTVYRSADGQPGGILGLITDITDQKESVDMLLKAATAAEAANEAKSSFLANMSHEIRTPMNAIIGMTNLALEGPLSEDQRELIGIVQSSGQALLSLINDILDHSKIEAGRFDLEHQPFDLHDCIGLAVTMMREKAREKSLHLETAIAEDVPALVVGDGHRLRQVLLNLLSNAVKFTAAGGVRVVVTRRGGEAGDRVMLHVRVRDTGIGIPEDKLDAIFEPFTQADSSTTRRFGGTGLGLSICRRIVGLMGGEMWVESRPGEGSTFHFTLSLNRADAALASARRPVQGLLRGEARDPGPEAATARILIVEHAGSGTPGPCNLHEVLASWSARIQVRPTMQAALQDLALEPVDAPASASMPAILAKASELDVTDREVLRRHAACQGAPAPVILLEDAAVDEALRRDVSRCVAWPTDASTLFDAMTGATRFIESALGDVDPLAAEADAPRRHRILLVEDNPINQKLALRLLNGLGHQVVVANDGAEAVERVSAEAFDLVFMDVQMPVMGGFEATDMIRRLELPLNRHTPIVAMTAHAMSGDRERCLNAGMDGYVSKPISRQDLMAAIADHAVVQSGLTRPAPLAVEPAAGAAIAAAPAAPAQFDRDRALAQLGGDEELFVDLARMYLEALDTDLAKLARTARSGHLDDLANVAHALKGSAAALGGRPAQALAGDLEQACRAGDASDLAGRVERLDAALRRLGEALAAMLAEPAQAGA